MENQNHYSKSEVGHIKNLENYNDLILYCRSLEPIYNPSRDQIKVSTMQEHYLAALDANENLRQARYELTIGINYRQEKFQGYKKKATRMYGALVASTSDQLIIADFLTVNRKIQGKLSIPRTNEDQANQEIMRAVSNSQQSIDQIMDHFADAIQILELVPDYNPNEEDLKISALKTYLQGLREANAAVESRFITYSKSLDERDNIFYSAAGGIVQVTKMVKAYIKSIYGFNSPEHRYVRNIRFKSRTRY